MLKASFSTIKLSDLGQRSDQLPALFFGGAPRNYAIICIDIYFRSEDVLMQIVDIKRNRVAPRRQIYATPVLMS